MKTAAKIFLPLLLLAIWLPGGDFALAQEQKDETEAGEPKKKAAEEEEEKKEDWFFTGGF